MVGPKITQRRKGQSCCRKGTRVRQVDWQARGLTISAPDNRWLRTASVRRKDGMGGAASCKW
jgi:hypothetical protein